MTTLKLEEKLRVGTFLRRLNRFMVEVQLQSGKVLAHLPNSGRLVTVLVPEATAFMREKSHAERKSSYDLFAVEHSGVPIIVDTRCSTVASQKAIAEGLFTALKGYDVVRKNVKVNHSLLDLLLQHGAKHFFLEIKCVTHVVNGLAMFPDAPTVRGRKHIESLVKLVQQGSEAGVLFSVQRPDANVLKPYRKIDPSFSRLLQKASEEGVKIFTQKLIFRFPNKVEIQPNVPVFQF